MQSHDNRNRVDAIKDYFNQYGIVYYSQLVKWEYPDFDDHVRLRNIMAYRFNPDNKKDIEIIEMLESIINKREKTKQ